MRVATDDQPTDERQELIDFIGIGGKLPDQLRVRFGDGYPLVLASLIKDGYVYEHEMVLRESAPTPQLAAQAPTSITSYLLTNKGKFALRLP
jgi:hypothetical protein